jgi:hypothetical protein
MKTNFWSWLTARDGGPVPEKEIVSNRELRVAYYEKSFRAAVAFQEHCYAAWVDGKTIELTIGHAGVSLPVSVMMDDAGKNIMQDVFCFAFRRAQFAEEALRKEREALREEAIGGAIVNQAGRLETGEG